jgi:glycosyltransferase involved in cell wall biosynthesis
VKVAVVAGAIHPADPGKYGSEHQAAVLARGFERAGHEVTFIAAAGSVRVGRYLPVPCMFGHTFPNEETNQYEWYRDELLRQDLVIDWSGTHRVTENLHFWDRGTFGGVLLWSHQGNVFTSPRAPALQRYHGTVVSQAQKDHALAHPMSNAGLPAPERVHVLPYGIDTETYRPPDAGDGDRRYFLYLSRPHPHKGIYEFLELARERPDEAFVMAFDMAAADHREHGARAIERAKELPNVRYIPLRGSLATKVGLYQHAKALVIPLAKDYVEGFGLVFAESMACGTPCLTATHGGQVDVVGDTGWLCRTREEYLAAIDAVAHRPLAVPPDDAARCRERIVRKFSVGRWVAAYLKLYAKVRRELDAGDYPLFPGWMGDA